MKRFAQTMVLLSLVLVIFCGKVKDLTAGLSPGTNWRTALLDSFGGIRQKIQDSSNKGRHQR